MFVLYPDTSELFKLNVYNIIVDVDACTMSLCPVQTRSVPTGEIKRRCFHMFPYRDKLVLSNIEEVNRYAIIQIISIIITLRKFYNFL